MEILTRRAINDLRLIAFATSDLGKRERVLKIIDCISNQETWPDEEEMTQLRLKFFIS